MLNENFTARLRDVEIAQKRLEEAKETLRAAQMSRHKRPARFRKGSVFQATANRILSASAASAVSNTAQRNRTSSSPSIPSRKTGKFRVSSAMPTILKTATNQGEPS
jgi:hypothetical protein